MKTIRLGTFAPLILLTLFFSLTISCSNHETQSDPELVKWEPDVYWIKVGGEDGAAYIRKYSGRCPLIHLKDMTADESRTFAEVGEGIIDWPPIFAASEPAAAVRPQAFDAGASAASRQNQTGFTVCPTKLPICHPFTSAAP